MKLKLTATLLAFSMLAGCGAQNTSFTSEAETSTNETSVSSTSDFGPVEILGDLEVSSVTDPAEYESGEVFVSYEDGSFEVLTFEQEGLEESLQALLEDETVAFIQPNYSYASSVLETTDELAAQQWALSNDGTFQMEERQNPYPVYEDPFDTPFGPGQWMMPGNFGQPGGAGRFNRKSYWGHSDTQQATTATAGIDINAEDAWSVYDGGTRDVVVALIDTGVDGDHEDLQDVLWINEDEVAGNGIDDDGNGYIDDVNGWNFYNNSSRIYVNSDHDSHGTHGAGTIAATADNGVGISGIVNSDHVKIMSLKALGGSDGSGSTASIIKAIQYAEANGASICNLSLGSSTDDRALYHAIANSSMLFVVAAGNDGADLDQSPCYPASYSLDNIISVANLNYTGELHYSSNYSPKAVDLAAPGTYILSTTPENEYSYMTGTSMAAPMVTGAAAMLYSYHEDITLADVKEILLSSTMKLEGLEGSVLTEGMLDLGSAMNYDLFLLSGETWETPDAADQGSAPEIQLKSVSEQGRQYLQVQVTDTDGDLVTTAYSSGGISAEYFRAGSVGTAFSVDESGVKLFQVKRSGTYTFYACDSAGNETVKTVAITVQETHHPSYSSPYTRPIFNRTWRFP